METMNANQSIIESQEPPRAEEADYAIDSQSSEPKPLRLLQAHTMEDETQSDSFKKTASIFGRALSALFR